MQIRIANKLNHTSRMRLLLILPFAMLIGSLIAGLQSYSKAKVHLTEELNEAMINLANAKGALLANPDTIKALRHMKEAVNQPITYKASELEILQFDDDLLKEGTFFQLVLFETEGDKGLKSNSQRVGRLSTKKSLADKWIVSDSIVIIPQGVADGTAIELTGYTECNMASVFFISDQRLSFILFILSILTFLLLLRATWRTKGRGLFENICLTSTPIPQSTQAKEESFPIPSFNSNPNPNNGNSMEIVDLCPYKLTPMQRRFMEMMLQAPGYRVGKYDLCDSLWDGKTNAEESLYTLVRRTKQAIKGSGIEILCNRGESYELRINR